MKVPFYILWLSVWAAIADCAEYRDLLKLARSNGEWSQEVFGSDENPPAWPLPPQTENKPVLIQPVDSVQPETDDRWRNEFLGPNIYLGSNVQVGQREYNLAASAGDNHNNRRHKHYDNLDSCECTDEIAQEKGRPTAAPPSHWSSTSFPILLGKRFEADFPTDDYRNDFQYGGHFGNHGGGRRDREESSAEKLRRKLFSSLSHADYHHNTGSDARFRKLSGFRNPITNECYCPGRTTSVIVGSTATDYALPFASAGDASYVRTNPPGSGTTSTGSSTTSSSSGTTSTGSGTTSTTPILTSPGFTSGRTFSTTGVFPPSRMRP